MHTLYAKSTYFFIRDEFHKFWYLKRVLEPIPSEYHKTTLLSAIITMLCIRFSELTDLLKFILFEQHLPTIKFLAATILLSFFMSLTF